MKIKLIKTTYTNVWEVGGGFIEKKYVTNQPDYNIMLQYSKNGGTWTNYTLGNVVSLNQNDTLALSGDNQYFSFGIYKVYDGSVDQSMTYLSCYQFQMTGLVESKGNIQSIVNFKDTMDEWCYAYLFAGCSGLLTPPYLPATTLTQGCYVGMFSGCTNLSTAPYLPAITLERSCYLKMFEGCFSLIKAPYLPATTTEPRYCYCYMFHNCISLNQIEVSFTNWCGDTLDNPYQWSHWRYWLNSVSPTGIFIKPQELPIIYHFDYGDLQTDVIPSGWTVLNRINGNLYYAQATSEHAVGDLYTPY